jgi:phage terminase large subunit
VFYANQQSKADVVINQGGTDSSKTVSIMQLLFTIAIGTEPPEIDPIITIVNKSVPDSKKGAYRIAESFNITNEYVSAAIDDWNKTDRVIKFKSGWIMEFVGAVDEQTAKQGKRQYLFCNEANGITWMVFWQYAKRTRIRVFVDYNPTAPFWVHDKLIGTTKNANDLNADVQLIISDHRHNPFLSQKDHDRTENIKDPELWKVYARGMTGNLMGLIYPDWTMIPDKEFPWDDPSKFGGLDFGYTNDPTAGVRLCRIANKIYIHELCYAPGITAIKLKQIFRDQGFKSSNIVYSEHDGDMIRQLRTVSKQEKYLMEEEIKSAEKELHEEITKKYKYTLMAIAARKGPNSILPGINKLKEYEIFYTESSLNIKMERERYMWIIDPDTGKPLNEPVDHDNHLMDAIRYAVYTQFFRH